MENSIRHEGTVESVDGGHVRVRITQHSACSACKIASHCTASESKEKMVDVYHSSITDLKTGDKVVVSTSGQTAGKALLLGFGLPLLLIIAVLGLLLSMGAAEGTAALSALGALVPYYILLWTQRHRIARDIAFKIEQTN